MPTFHLVTNVPGDRVTNSDVLKALSKAVAQTIEKPEEFVMCCLTTDKPMVFAGSEEPCAFGYLMSIGGIGGDKNKKISAALCEVISSHLKVPSDRVYIQFSDVKASDVGWSGTTFD